MMFVNYPVYCSTRGEGGGAGRTKEERKRRGDAVEAGRIRIKRKEEREENKDELQGRGQVKKRRDVRLVEWRKSGK